MSRDIFWPFFERFELFTAKKQLVLCEMKNVTSHEGWVGQKSVTYYLNGP